MFKKLATKAAGLRNKIVMGVAAMSVAGQSMAADAIDSSGPVATITGGLAALGAIGAAWVGFKYLQKVWARV